MEMFCISHQLVQNWRCLLHRQGYLSCTLHTGVPACTHTGTSPHWGRCKMTNRLIVSNKFTPVTAHQSSQVLLFSRHDTPWCVRLGILKDNISDRQHPDATAQNAILTISRVTSGISAGKPWARISAEPPVSIGCSWGCWSAVSVSSCYTGDVFRRSARQVGFQDYWD